MVGDKTIDIPLIALISHHYLAMDNVQIKFKAKVGSVESQIPENNLLLSSPHRANLQMQMSNIKPNADDVMEVCVNFKIQETPESISRIIDDFVKKYLTNLLILFSFHRQLCGNVRKPCCLPYVRSKLRPNWGL